MEWQPDHGAAHSAVFQRAQVPDPRDTACNENGPRACFGDVFHQLEIDAPELTRPFGGRDKQAAKREVRARERLDEVEYVVRQLPTPFARILHEDPSLEQIDREEDRPRVDVGKFCEPLGVSHSPGFSDPVTTAEVPSAAEHHLGDAGEVR